MSSPSDPGRAAPDAARPAPPPRSAYRCFVAFGTRWMDNVVYCTLFDTAAAGGHFIHVHVDRATRRPVPLPARLRDALKELA